MLGLTDFTMSQSNSNYMTALLLAAGGSGKQILSSDDMAGFGACLLANIESMLKRSPYMGGQQYGSATELATRYGRSVNTVKVWLRKLEAQGEIHPIQGAPEREGAKGDTLYSFVEVDEALRKKRMAYVENQNA